MADARGWLAAVLAAAAVAAAAPAVHADEGDERPGAFETLYADTHVGVGVLAVPTVTFVGAHVDHVRIFGARLVLGGRVSFGTSWRGAESDPEDGDPAAGVGVLAEPYVGLLLSSRSRDAEIAVVGGVEALLGYNGGPVGVDDEGERRSPYLAGVNLVIERLAAQRDNETHEEIYGIRLRLVGGWLREAKGGGGVSVGFHRYHVGTRVTAMKYFEGFGVRWLVFYRF